MQIQFSFFSFSQFLSSGIWKAKRGRVDRKRQFIDKLVKLVSLSVFLVSLLCILRDIRNERVQESLLFFCNIPCIS